MAKAVPLRQALFFWFAAVGSAVLLYYGGRLSDFLISDVHASAFIRWCGAIVAALSIVPWMLIVWLSLSMIDEYYRQVALLGTAIAFVLDLLLHIALNVAVDARLLSRGGLMPPELVLAIVTWMFGIAIAFTYYRYRL